MAWLVDDEGKKDIVINGYGEGSSKLSYEDQNDDEKYEYFIMDKVAENKHFSEEDWAILGHLKEKYGTLTEEEYERFSERVYNASNDYFDEDD